MLYYAESQILGVFSRAKLTYYVTWKLMHAFRNDIPVQDLGLFGAAVSSIHADF